MSELVDIKPKMKSSHGSGGGVRLKAPRREGDSRI